jgi:hypothetical protein
VCRKDTSTADAAMRGRRHLEGDPLEGDEDAADAADDQVTESEPVAKSPPRRVRSTRWRSDVEELPRLPVEHRSVGRIFLSPG